MHRGQGRPRNGFAFSNQELNEEDDRSLVRERGASIRSSPRKTYLRRDGLARGQNGHHYQGDLRRTFGHQQGGLVRVRIPHMRGRFQRAMDGVIDARSRAYVVVERWRAHDNVRE